MLPGMSTATVTPIPATPDARELGDGLGIFLQRIARTRLLTHAEELELARRIERGDLAAKDELVTANLRLVHSIAQRYRDRGVPIEDLVQEGSIGLIRAAEKFDHRRGLKFSTYAVWWIRRSILDALADAQAIRIPAAARQQLATILRAEDELREGGTGAPSDDAIAERAGLSPHTVRTLRGAARVTASLDEPVGGDGTMLAELIAAPDAEPVGHRIERDETRGRVASLLRLLPARHREVLLRRYGVDRDAQSHAQIAARLGVGEQRTRQLEHQALHWLRSVPLAPAVTHAGTR